MLLSLRGSSRVGRRGRRKRRAMDTAFS
jgi:hypothetical protein